MEQLHYADEVRPTSEVTVPAGEVKPAELALAKQLIEQTANDEFEPEKYKDTVRERVLEAIQRKVDGQEITADRVPDTGGKIIDLMAALKASLETTPAAEKPQKKSRKAS
jgi:DNA end-binding protein Ku